MMDLLQVPKRGGMMKAIHIKEYVKDLSEIKPSYISIPTLPLPGQHHHPLALIRVTHTSPTHVDTLYARGLHQNNHAGLVRPPFTLGLEFSGIIVSLSSPSSLIKTDTNTSSTSSSSLSHSFTPGTPVWGTHTGTFQPYIIAPLTSIRPLPGYSPSLSPSNLVSLLSFFAGLGASTAPVSYGALVRVGNLQKHETVLIHGASGGLGIAAVMIAKAVGAHVIATVGREEKAKVLRKMLSLSPEDHDTKKSNDMKRDKVLIITDYHSQPWEKEVLHHLSSFSSSSNTNVGVDLVFDPIGLVTKSIRCCKFGTSRIVIVGFVGLEKNQQGKTKMETIPTNRILLKGVRLIGYRFGQTGRTDPEEMKRTWEGFEDLVSSSSPSSSSDEGKKWIEPVIFKRYQGLEYMNEALGLLARRGVVGKIVVEIGEDDIEQKGMEEKKQKISSML